MVYLLSDVCVPSQKFNVLPRLYKDCSDTQLTGDTIDRGHTHPSWRETYPIPTGPSVHNGVRAVSVVCPQSEIWYIAMMYAIYSTVKLTI